MNQEDTKLSKSLAWLLRHGAVKEGFNLSPEGYIDVKKILLHRSFRNYSVSDVERAVRQNDKQRFQLRINPETSTLEIKAHQGHSIQQISDADLTPILTPKYETVIHGTFYKAWNTIQTEGISRMNRKHVHLAHGIYSDKVKSGVWQNAEVYIYIDLERALAYGLKFYESANGVILTPGDAKGFISPKYFSKVIDVQSGYPNYTQPQDLLDVFTKFGNVRIDKCNNWSATLTYTEVKDAKRALEEHKKVHIYGHYLTIKPYSSKERGAMEENGRQQVNKRDFTRSKQKGMIIEPKKIDLAGDFHTQLDNILCAVRLTQEDVKALSTLYTDLENVLQCLWPGCKAIPFGSITTGLGIKTSDADCFINIPHMFRNPNANHVNKAKRVLGLYPHTFAELLSIPRANTPIVKFFHIPTDTNCDVTFKTPLGAQNSRLIAFLLHADPRLLPMAVIIKYWAKVHDLSGTGKLTNYALTMMIIFYLQQPPMCILPSVEWLQRNVDEIVVDHWNTGFMSQQAQLPPCSNTSSISELLGGFFEYYSLFNFEEMVVCPYLGIPVKKEVFKDHNLLPNEFERYKKNVANNLVMPIRFQSSFCVQDPFEQCHNVASTITPKLALDIKTFFKFAANAYEKEKLNNCLEFLRTILLQKPKLIRGKLYPEFRVNLFPRVISTIVSADWKSVIRELTVTIFEDMLKIKLGKVEEKVNPDSRKEKEKYMGTVTRQIWKRKQFVKLYCHMPDLSFEEKQARITNEVLRVEKQVLNLQFQLTLTFCHDPKSAVVAMRLTAGDMDQFKEFGRFFISMMHNWITELLKPYTAPNCNDTATKVAEMKEVQENNVQDDSQSDDEAVEDNKVQEVPETTPEAKEPNDTTTIDKTESDTQDSPEIS